MPSAPATIRRVVTRASSRQRIDAAVPLRALLDGVDWKTTALPDEAVFCARQLRLPLRRRLTPLPDPRFRRETQEAVNRQLALLVGTAARPARGAVPAGATAVLFEDKVELLACLARDWCRGGTSAHWWWTTLFRGPDLASIVIRTWRENPCLVPAALALLENSNLGARFLARLGEDDLDLLWSEVAARFDLRHLEAAWRPLPPASISREENPAASRDEPRRGIAPAPWDRWWTPPPGQPEAVVRLLSTALVLQQAPAELRSERFAATVLQWRQHRRWEMEKEPADFAREDSRPGDAPKSSPKTAAVSPAVSPSGKDRDHAVEVRAPEPVTSFRRDAGNQETLSARPGRTETTRPGEPAGETKPDASAPTRSDEAAAAPLLDGDDSVRNLTTACGGIFYLVNVALALGYYGDFTMPAARGLALPVWDFLALLGRRFVGASLDNDPLFNLLAGLSGRKPDEPPGTEFEPAGGKTLAVWLDETELAVRTRLAAALGECSREALAVLVFHHTAQVRASRTRVDVTFPLITHPIELRLSGLDRDPGWLPAGGRILAFHYE